MIVERMSISIDKNFAKQILECASACYGEGIGGDIDEMLWLIQKAWPDLADEYRWIYDLIRHNKKEEKKQNGSTVQLSG
jgi:hypothetical protein